MKYFVLLSLAGMVMLAACNKSSFQTKPQIKIKSISGNVVPLNGGMTIIFEYTDKEGDVSDSLFMEKVRINQRTATLLRPKVTLDIPDFPKAVKGEFEVNLEYQAHLLATSNTTENDSLFLKFAVRDKAGNVSDTLTSELIVIRKR
jgi:hypothetical protein